MELALPAIQGILVLVFVGFLLIAAELFLPGLILGGIGALCLIAAIAWSYAAFGPLTGTLVLAAIAIVGFVGFLVWLSVFPRTFVGKQIINTDTSHPIENSARVSLLGKEGVALTILRPAGTAKIDGRRVDVVAESSFIESGAPVSVIAVEGARVVVRKI